MPESIVAAPDAHVIATALKSKLASDPTAPQAYVVPVLPNGHGVIQISVLSGCRLAGVRQA